MPFLLIKRLFIRNGKRSAWLGVGIVEGVVVAVVVGRVKKKQDELA